MKIRGFGFGSVPVTALLVYTYFSSALNIYLLTGWLSADLSFLTVKVKRLKVWHLYTAAYRETRTAAVYNSKWRTDWQWHKWHSASSGRPLPEWTDFGPCSLQLDRPTNPQPVALWPSPRNVLRQRLTIFVIVNRYCFQAVVQILLEKHNR